MCASRVLPTLVSPPLRAQANLLDPTAFFAMIFGSEDFEPLVGPLKLAAMAQQQPEQSNEEAAFRQRQREVQCAVNLRDLLAPFDPALEGEHRSFEAAMRAKAEGLAVNAFGEELLHVIGYVYSLAGAKQLGRKESLGLKGHLLSMQQKGHVIGNQATVLGSGVKAWWSQRQASAEQAREQKHREALKAKKKAEYILARSPAPAPAAPGQLPRGPSEGGSASAAPVSPAAVDPALEAEAEAHAEAEVVAALEEAKAATEAKAAANQAKAMASMLETLWHVSVLDIEATLRAAAHKLLHDKGVDEAEIERRAKALIVVGKAFQETECKAEPEAEEAGGAASGGKRRKKTWKDHLEEQVRGAGAAGAAAESRQSPES